MPGNQTDAVVQTDAANDGFTIPFGPYEGWYLPFNDPLLPFQANMLGFVYLSGGGFQTVAHINIVPIWDEYSGAGVFIGTFESFDTGHPELINNFAYLESEGPIPESELASWTSAHGTMTTGIYGAEANNGIGLAGIANEASLAGINSSFESNYELADVVNASIGLGNYFFLHILNDGWDPLNPQAPTVAILNEGRGGLGTVWINGAGNEGDNDYSAEASRFTNLFEFMPVGRTDGSGLTLRSNFGSNLHITAPLVSSFYDATTISLDVRGDYGELSSDGSAASRFSRFADAGYDLDALGLSSGDYYLGTGTSATAPIVTGAVALVLEASTNNIFGSSGLGWRDVQEILAISARHTGTAIGSSDLHENEHHPWVVNGADFVNGGGLHHSADYGFGMLDVHGAVRLAETWQLQHMTSNMVVHDRTVGDGETITFGAPIELTFDLSGESDLDLDVVSLDLDFTHDNHSELLITLISPDGTESIVFDTPGLTATSFHVQQHELTGQLIWLTTSRAFWGESTVGTWTIRIEDTVDNGNSGTLGSITAHFKGDVATDDDTWYFTDDWALMNEANGGVPVVGDALGVNTLNMAALSDPVAVKLSGGATGKIGGEVAFKLANNAVFTIAIGTDQNDTLTGATGDEQLYGMQGDDVIWAGAGDVGDDQVHGGPGDDTLGGGAGNDLIVGGDGGDTGFGGTGDDTLVGGDWVDGAPLSAENDGHDTLWAGPGDDLVYGDQKGDVLGGGTGADEIWGRGGHDVIYAGQGDGADTLYGGSSNDTIYGGGGDDEIYGGSDQDLLFNGAGNDTVSGGTGNDTLWGGGGDDTLTGGQDADTFAFAAGNGSDTITDFSTADDTLNLTETATDFTDMASVESAASNTADGLLIETGGGDTILLEGISLTDLDSMDIVL